MNKEELKQYIKINDNGKAKNGFQFELDISYFGSQAYIMVSNIQHVNSEPEISILTEIIADLQAFDPNTTEWFKEKIWKHYQRNMKNAEFGHVNYDGFQNTELANYSHFKINSQEEAYKALHLDCVGIYVPKEGIRSFDLSFSCPWNLEHGILIGVANHQFVHMD